MFSVIDNIGKHLGAPIWPIIWRFLAGLFAATRDQALRLLPRRMPARSRSTPSLEIVTNKAVPTNTLEQPTGDMQRMRLSAEHDGKPSIVESVKQVSANRWRMGRALLECERLSPDNLLRPNDGALATWKDGNDWFILRASGDADAGEARTVPDKEDGPGDTVRLVHQLGSSSAVWAVGRDAFCKVKTWYPGLESEAKTIAFVREHCPQIPLPDVVYEYIDGDKSFLILKRVPGRTLRDAWADLSSASRNCILATVVDFCEAMATQTAPCLQSVTGGPIDEPYLSPDGARPFGPLTVQQGISYFSATLAESAPDWGAEFHFYHADLGPSNIMVSAAGAVTGILDWELAGFFPRFWISTKPSVSPGLNFCPSVADSEDYEWRKMLRLSLEMKGFSRAADWYMEWTKTKQHAWKAMG
ncbi:Uncharacterized protein TPAR_03986 [Tolypocladium paradoxum]|uniref:Aminoglycoside phosphotransferase domain-containing protein n=1 Tax=Tolypocladium paradoxum TaxID=94208 RepID=A0A2S4L070_9HYPO|nr:Uncharacterized protein TPAR_03986 [Tolypocladium paradoxum]